MEFLLFSMKTAVYNKCYVMLCRLGGSFRLIGSMAHRHIFGSVAHVGSFYVGDVEFIVFFLNCYFRRMLLGI